MKILVTGHAGFIGYFVARALLERGDDVVGIDCVNDYYDPTLKDARLAELEKVAKQPGSGTLTSLRANLADRGTVDSTFDAHAFDRVIHLAAQAGVRYSIEQPRAYVESNVVAFTNILEACRAARSPHLTYASTSSVYGSNTKLPYAESDGANHPVQFYAATKRANELMAHAYSHLFALPTTGLRFFTVYGPWGRPDMAPFLFTQRILAGEPIPVFSGGHHSRDFTYIDDIVTGVIRASDQIAEPDPNWRADTPDPSGSAAPYRIFNIGNGDRVELMRFIRAIETATGKTAILDMKPAQPGDIADTLADVSALEKAVGYRPATRVEDGVAALVQWYRAFYKV